MRVLVIDDNGALRGLARAILEGAGHEVAEAADGGEGLALCGSLRPDVVVTDLFMPGRDGVDVIRELRRDRPGVGVVAMSGGGLGGAVDLLPVSRALGACEALAKPFRAEDLLAAVGRAARGAGGTEAAEETAALVP